MPFCGSSPSYHAKGREAIHPCSPEARAGCSCLDPRCDRGGIRAEGQAGGEPPAGEERSAAIAFCLHSAYLNPTVVSNPCLHTPRYKLLLFKADLRI